ncbi:hypothetical protein CAEBREN_09346 [Caenorhabditis brenneri]|uniref:Uncharacterized protein n=1 Tax=Caenorhabditis brenneri TaxID=135651 RepID=G0P2J1_CAEBE|nr:hypothetical protein CAEBREN_09346 [Caenorhabditis brenneri]
MKGSNGIQKMKIKPTPTNQNYEKRHSFDKKCEQSTFSSCALENLESSQLAVKRCSDDSGAIRMKKCRKEVPEEGLTEKQNQLLDTVSLTFKECSSFEDHSTETNTTLQNQTKLVSTKQQIAAIVDQLGGICCDNSKLPGFDELLARYRYIRQQPPENWERKTIEVEKLVNCFQETLPIVCQGRHTATRNDSTVFGYTIVIAFSTMISELNEYSTKFPNIKEMMDKSKKKIQEIECHKSDEEDMIFQYVSFHMIWFLDIIMVFLQRIKTSKVRDALSTWSKVFD